MTLGDVGPQDPGDRRSVNNSVTEREQREQSLNTVRERDVETTFVAEAESAEQRHPKWPDFRHFAR